MLRSLIAVLILTLGGGALAADKKAKPKKPMFDGPLLSLPSEALPTGEKLEKRSEEKLGDGPKVSAGNASYDILKVQHAKGFMRSPGGAAPQGGELKQIGLTGNPPSTEKFSTIIRVKSNAKNNVPIEVAVVDPRGDTVMNSSGTVVFAGSKQDEIDYQIDWDPTPLRGGGEYKFLVRVANEVKGTWPVQIVDKK